AYADPSRPHTQVAAWYGAGGEYEGIVLTFFKSPTDARASLKSLVGPYGGKLVRNVVVSWAQKALPRPAVRDAVIGCLQAASSRAAPHAVPAASLTTFVGGWGGHTRQLSISPAGRGTEYADDGCCTRDYAM